MGRQKWCSRCSSPDSHQRFQQALLDSDWLKQLPPATAGLAAWLYTRHAELPVISLPAGATVPGSHGTRWLCALAPAAVIQSLLEALWLSDYEQLGHNSRLAANSGT